MNNNIMDFEEVLDYISAGLTKEFPNSTFSFEKVLKDFWGIRYYLIKDGARQGASLSMDSIMEAHHCAMMRTEYVAALIYEVKREHKIPT